VTGKPTQSHGRPAQVPFRAGRLRSLPLFARCVQSKVRGRIVTETTMSPIGRSSPAQGTDEFKALYRLRPKSSGFSRTGRYGLRHTVTWAKPSASSNALDRSGCHLKRLFDWPKGATSLAPLLSQAG